MGTRVKLFWKLLWHGRWRPIEAGVLMIGVYDTLMGQFSAGWPTIGKFLPQVNWWGWVILLLLVMLFAVLEGAYRISQKVAGEFNFEFNDSSITTKDDRILLGVSYFPSDRVTIETLQLEYNGELFRPQGWSPIEISQPHTKNYTFALNDLKAIADEASQEAVLIAKVNGEKHRSHPFNIYKLF